MNKLFLGIILYLLFAGVTAYAREKIEFPLICQSCGMSRGGVNVKNRVLITYADGSVVGTCSLYCVALVKSKDRDHKIVSIKVANYMTGELIDAKSAIWVIGSKNKGVMSSVARFAFANKKDAQSYIDKYGGKVATFEQAIKLAEIESAAHRLNYPPSRLWASSKNAEKRRLTESCVAIMTLLPELLRENGFCYSCLAKVDESHMLALFIVNGGQGLLMQVFGEERMAHLLEEIGRQQNKGPMKTVVIDKALFDGAGAVDRDAIGQLLKIFGVEAAVQDRILNALANVASAQYDLWWKLTENKRSEIISRIGGEIVDNKVQIIDLLKYLVVKESYDLFEHDRGELIAMITQPRKFRGGLIDS
ncbi:nitrous oxide reductase accessory protein NosL [Geomobilimonas luticola]|uniref:Nitrous oxide reductase accessory protein NosL n=1 Tax=Geomobilimonas luticola TaxID=1114878 RepID=A0ABS5SDJ8_9BACT|nr:nitrous oxide reductase accessory protein NosL [Geomobilimonas luticola]MBT0653428.1 nitrous oxide reductase accessory protein NosL [Geomobilimonas luticola]